MSTHSSTSAPTGHSLWMSQAIALARKGTALTHPNPMVGAVLVKEDRIIGEGFHVFDRLDHAEIAALNQAAGNARGASLYVSLEPGCTTGRTGPCTKAIIEAGYKPDVLEFAQDGNLFYTATKAGDTYEVTVVPSGQVYASTGLPEQGTGKPAG